MSETTGADCLFCRIVAGGIPSDVVAETECSLAFRDVDPQAPTTAALSDAPSCAAELCPDANAPRASAPRFQLLLAGVIAFGDARLLSERAASSSESLPVLLSAPKTSPPAESLLPARS